MTNRINPYRASAAAMQPTAPRRLAAMPDAPAAKQESAAGLTAAEQTAIDRLFPPSETLEMRVYGAGRQAHTVNPKALGTRLDLRG